MRLLLHMCCGPCALYPVRYLRDQGFEVYGHFYNPNIHPYSEFAKRMETLQKWAMENELQMIYNDDYKLEEYLQSVVFREKGRCQVCYNMRLRQTALVARNGKFDYFSTTLLISPFQKHEMIKATGEAVGQEYGVSFYYADFRPGFKEAVVESKAEGMYRQQYCGCIYSEKERYYRPRKEKGGRDNG